MARRVAHIMLTLAVCVSPAVRDSLAEEPVQITLSSVSDCYLRGEPVCLSVTIQNVANEPVPVWVDLLKGQIRVFISKKGAAYTEYRSGLDARDDVVPPVEFLQPGGRKSYILRVLFVFQPEAPSEGLLALPHPDDYSFKVNYPL